MKSPVRIAFVFLAAVALAGPGCRRAPAGSSGDAKPATTTSGKAPFSQRFTINVGAQAVRMRLAVTSFEMERGLMQVPSMPEDEGMIFVYDRTQQMSFWMRNTILPLDIGFFDAKGVLQEIHPMYPHVEDPVRSANDRMQFALEMNQGWYARHGVKPGDSLDMAALHSALKERGFDTKRN